MRLSALGRHEQALAAVEESVAIRRGLAATNRDAYNPDLAVSLHNLGTSLRDLGRYDEALTAAEKAVALYRRLCSRWPDAFRGRLATADKLLSALRAAGRTPDEPVPPLEQ
jgi:tetratricopeptide (TPR) repeat protein